MIETISGAEIIQYACDSGGRDWPPPHPRRAALKAHGHSLILDAAEAVFEQEGYIGARVRTIARHSGVARGTLYRHFGSKAELYVAVLDRRTHSPFTEKLRNSLPRGARAPEQLRWIARQFVAHGRKNPREFKVFDVLSDTELAVELSSETLERLRERWNDGLEQLASVIQQGIDAGDFAPRDPWKSASLLWRMLHALFGGAFTQLGRERSTAGSLEQTVEQATEIIPQGLEARS